GQQHGHWPQLTF
nr:immunoglobulin light chain junction region [Macaca mulatta]